MRLFLGIRTNKSINDAVFDVIEKHDVNSIGKFNTVKKDNMHITAKFIGDYRGNISKIIDVVSKFAMNNIQFKLKFNKCGYFPNSSNPKILWAGFEHGKQLFIDLTKKLDSDLSDIGIKKNNQVQIPHLTIFRIKKVFKSELLKNLESDLNESILNIEQIVNEIVLFKSELKTSGPIYTPMKSFEFRGCNEN